MNKIAIAAALLIGLAATPALAQEVRIEVSYADLDIATPEGAGRLADRIAGSVKSACAVSDARGVKAAAIAGACQSELLAGAVEQLNTQGAALAAESVAAKG